ncbi:MAG: acylneuraminate cytidylyltransferase family protein [Phycisphaerae bacterium]|nr:acylneuraminate cytidylyltransferase family protein [Phycisphaerae bacterium]
MPTVYAMIPARGGSRGIPRKNLVDFAGKPLIVHTINAALASQYIDRLMVSTEDDEIADVVRQAGAEVPFRRPAELATDTATGSAVSRHWLEWLKTEGHDPWAVMHLQATSPLRTADDIDRAVELLRRADDECVASVCPVTEHPAYMYRLNGDRAVPFLDEEALPSHRQRAEPVYRLNGAIFVTRFAAALAAGQFHLMPFAALVMPAERSIDVDTPLDLALAETIHAEMSTGTAQERT